VYVDLQDESYLQQGGRHLQPRWDLPCHVSRDAVGPETHGRRGNLTKVEGDIEEAGEICTLLGVAKLSDEGRSRHDTRRNAKAKQDASSNVHSRC
jgi:hypothetical protein